ncbi:MAG TPA: hypothetical protein VLN91_01855 [Nitrospirota bacterium]|nr:hypothetical protein [Nitrospirota bacterium]
MHVDPKEGPRFVKERRRNSIFAAITTVFVLFSFIAPSVMADNNTQPATGEEGKFYATVVAPAMILVKKALPPAPPGWVVAGEAKLDTAPLEKSAGGMRSLRFSCFISYKRVEGIQAERKRLDDAYRDSSSRHEEAVKPQIAELLKKQTETSLKLRKATRRRNQKEMQRLNDELDENGKTMRAIHAETDGKIALDMEKYLIKDSEASIRVFLNDDGAELLNGEPVSVRGATFALRREGERAGPAGWKEGQTLVLYGDWLQEGERRYRAKGEQQPFAPKVKTVKVLITGEKKRAEQLFKKMDVKSVLSLMK